jgi:hypothetical protein
MLDRDAWGFFSSILEEPCFLLNLPNSCVYLATQHRVISDHYPQAPSSAT